MDERGGSHVQAILSPPRPCNGGVPGNSLPGQSIAASHRPGNGRADQHNPRRLLDSAEDRAFRQGHRFAVHSSGRARLSLAVLPAGGKSSSSCKTLLNLRRAFLIERLLKHPDYARHWGNRWATWSLPPTGPFSRGRYGEELRAWLEVPACFPLYRGVRDTDPAGPYRDLLWALLNSNDFLLNH